MRLSDVFRFCSKAHGPSPDAKASAAAPAAAPRPPLLAVPPAAHEVPAPEHARVRCPPQPGQRGRCRLRPPACLVLGAHPPLGLGDLSGCGGAGSSAWSSTAGSASRLLQTGFALRGGSSRAGGQRGCPAEGEGGLWPLGALLATGPRQGGRGAGGDLPWVVAAPAALPPGTWHPPPGPEPPARSPRPLPWLGASSSGLTCFSPPSM